MTSSATLSRSANIVINAVRFYGIGVGCVGRLLCPVDPQIHPGAIGALSAERYGEQLGVGCLDLIDRCGSKAK
jgi:hypothetical protein